MLNDRESNVCYVQAIQVSKDDPQKVDVVWVVFNDENVGRLYRAEHKHLRKQFNPNHPRATPILPIRRKFKAKFGNIEYQRQNFALSLGYAITAHKCQGWTLEQVIIDFGPDLNNNIKNYIICGSFYVALTRVREGNNVFLKSFDQSYVQVNPRIQEKVEAMLKFQSYSFKKIYLGEEIFEHNNQEIKIGYFNINGLLSANHAEYFDSDQNLSHLDLIVISETKLNSLIKRETIEVHLKNWIIVDRFDAVDNIRHMGLMVLSKIDKRIEVVSITQHSIIEEGSLQVQGIIVTLKNDFSVAAIYSRRSPTTRDIDKMKKVFGHCDVLMGDFNLSHRIDSHQEKLKALCNNSKENILKEITRSISNNQLDYVLVSRTLKENCFATSYYNFISDHKSIALRIGVNGNKLSKSTIWLVLI